MDWIRVIPLIGKLLTWWRSWSGVNRDHDSTIFRKLDAIVNESRVDDILNYRIYTSDHKVEYDQLLADFIDSLLRIENQYSDSVIRLRAEQLAWEMGKLLDIVRKTFWPVPGGRLKFRPDPIDKDVYDAEWKELNEKLERAWEAYKTYRQAIKDRLMV